MTDSSNVVPAFALLDLLQGRRIRICGSMFRVVRSFSKVFWAVSSRHGGVEVAAASLWPAVRGRHSELVGRGNDSDRAAHRYHELDVSFPGR